MRFLLLPFVLLCSLLSAAQADSLIPVHGVPSREVYDLLRDHNGFIWMGHNAGISRYDGRNFVNYSNPLQNGRAMTDLCEDRQGRIWCHNFEGQIFYVDSSGLQLLQGYAFRQERFFPRTAIYGNELVATSSRGFFNCHTGTLKPHYYVFHETTSLAVLPGGVLMLAPGYGFYWYQAGRGVRLLKTRFVLTPMLDFALQPESIADTANMLVNPTGAVYRFVVRGDSLLATDSAQMPEYINAITVDRNDWWIHTNGRSISGQGRQVAGQYLSNIVSDVQGHSFASSVRYGLLATYRTQALPLSLPFLAAGDYVKSIARLRTGAFLYGTQSGSVFWVEEGAVRGRFRIAPRNGPVEHIWKLEDSLYLLAGNQGIFRLDLKGRSMTEVDFNIVVKDCAISGQQVVLATTMGMLRTDLGFLKRTTGLRALVPSGTNLRRSRSVCIGNDGVLYVSFNKGSFAWSKGDSTALSYGGTPIYATRMRNFAGGVLIATFIRGLFLRRPGRPLEPLPATAAQQGNTAPDIKIAGNSAWIIYDDAIQQLGPDLRARELANLPFRGPELFDLIEDDGSLLAATARGLFRLPKWSTGAPLTHTVVDYVRLNDSINAGGRHRFSHRQNNISIGLSTPWFTSSDHLRYRYRLCSEDNCSWLLSPEGQGSFTFINLAPGAYTFSAVAVNGNGTALAPEVSYSFTIDPPWWGAWWARLGLVLLLTTLFFLLGLYGQRRRARRQRARYEKMLAVEHERQRISAEIHDDLGATLSGVRLLTELAREKMPPGPLRGDLEKIHQSITSLTEKTREVIWTLNTEQDSVESLLLYIQKAAQHLFEASPIQLQVQLPVELPGVRISGDVRRHVYLAVKEALHNCLKHSGATWCRLQLQCPEGRLHITVQDNGRGIPTQGGNGSFSSGMRTMQQRMAYAGGSLHLHSNEYGTQIDFVIPLPQNNG